MKRDTLPPMPPKEFLETLTPKELKILEEGRLRAGLYPKSIYGGEEDKELNATELG